MNILWDLDGTIFDTYPTIVENIYTEIPEERKGLVTREDVLKLAKVNAKFAMDMLDFNEVQRSNVYARVNDLNPLECPPFPYVIQVLDVSYLNVIMTHKGEKAMKTLLSFYGMRGYFKEIVTKDSGFPKKPDSTSYQYLHEKYKIDLVVGDRQLDLIPAKELGILTCSFQNNLPQADYYIDSYSDFGAVYLGINFNKKSHVKKTPLLNQFWIKNTYKSNLELCEEVLNTFEKIEDKELAALFKIGCLEENKISGFYPIDSALFALEHGFPPSVVKCILHQKEALNHLNGQSKEYMEIYSHINTFLTEEEKNRLKKFERDRL